ncbi:hypothetical protein SLEP1_g47633 [Rubroshorea leprosula]|uniref:Uncharacterized protein n=1 Tax=Rubroshorea leprosula TaxID=152421 RepID=A0AAV5LSV9_9ROSI|nr:hypothetical protein SLEP1_g47633 [Rubroshorea leprosula]
MFSTQHAIILLLDNCGTAIISLYIKGVALLCYLCTFQAFKGLKWLESLTNITFCQMLFTGGLFLTEKEVLL